jgi:hypothetical protein
MNHVNLQKKGVRQERDYEWVWEILLLATVSPALVYGILSLNHLPVV